jgi:hypothetical protein
MRYRRTAPRGSAPPATRARPGHLLAEALKLYRRGWRVRPAAGKRPAVGHYRHIRTAADRPAESDLGALFTRPGVTGFGVLTGPASGGLVNRDFEGGPGRPAAAAARAPARRGAGRPGAPAPRPLTPVRGGRPPVRHEAAGC